MRFFGQTSSCPAEQTAFNNAQNQFNMSMAAGSGVPDPAAQAAMIQAAQALSACQNQPSTAQQFQQGASAVGSILGPLANIGAGLFAASQPKPLVAPGPNVIMPVAASSNNTTLIIVGVIAAVVVLLVVLMKK